MITPLEPIPAYFFPYEVPVMTGAFPTLAFICSTLGLVLFAWFFTLQVTRGNDCLNGLSFYSYFTKLSSFK